MIRLSEAVLVLVAAVLGSGPSASAGADGHGRPDVTAAVDHRGFEAHEYRDAQGSTLRYRWLRPAASRGEEPQGDGESGRPLLVFLHGMGERGTDNRRQLVWGETLLRAAARDYGAFVLIPQCPPTDTWTDRREWRKDHAMRENPTEPMRLLIELIDRLSEERPIDARRIYVMGLSMGGFGTWEMISRWPERFAAAVPICGGGDENQARRLVDTPIWAFHGSADWIVPPERSRSMIEAIRRAGGTPRYTEYPGVGHGSWIQAFTEPGMLDWVFAQRRAEDQTGVCASHIAGTRRLWSRLCGVHRSGRAMLRGPRCRCRLLRIGRR